VVAGGLGTDIRSALSAALHNRFEFMRDDRQDISNDWFDCPGFIVRRLDGDIALGIDHA
jgi:hypothetical protein